MYLYQNGQSVQIEISNIYHAMFQPKKRRMRESRNVYRAHVEKPKEDMIDPALKELLALSLRFVSKYAILDFAFWKVPRLTYEGKR